MYDEAKRERDEFEVEELGPELDGSWHDWDAQCWGEANDREVETLSRVLDVLQAIANGLVPAQGAPR
jgi:hypothetical protein